MQNLDIIPVVKNSGKGYKIRKIRALTLGPPEGMRFSPYFGRLVNPIPLREEQVMLTKIGPERLQISKGNVIISKDITKFLEKVLFMVEIYVVLYASYANSIKSTITIMQLQG